MASCYRPLPPLPLFCMHPSSPPLLLYPPSLWWMPPLINLDVFPLAVFFHRPSNLSLIAINHRGKQMLGTKATCREGGWVVSWYMCLCVWVWVCMCVVTRVQQGGALMKLGATQKLGACEGLTSTLGCEGVGVSVHVRLNMGGSACHTSCT